MADNTSGAIAALRALVDGSMGLAKQVVGILIGNDRLQEQGKAQQDKAEAEKDVAKKEAAAEEARSEAKTQETRQKAAQKSQNRFTGARSVLADRAPVLQDLEQA